MSQDKIVVSDTQKKFILPFSEAKLGSSKSSLETEVAAVFAIAELDREKGGRIISRHSIEKISSIARIGYPLFFYPLGEKVFLFDGLNIEELSLPYVDVPDIKSFLEGLRSGSKKRESFSSFIEEKAVYFDKSDNKKTLQLKSLITDQGLQKGLSDCRSEVTDSLDWFADVALLSSPLNESKLLAVTREIAQLRSSLEKDCKELITAIEILRKSSSIFHNELHEEMGAVKQEFALEIRREEAIAAPIIRTLHEQYDRKIVALVKAIEKQALPLQSEKLQLKKKKTDLTKEISTYEERAKALGDSDKESKERWKLKIKNAKEDLSAVEKQLKNNDKTLEDLEKKKASQTLENKDALEKEIKEARRKIVELESSRDAKVLVIKQEMEDLETETKALSDNIAKTIKLRETDIAQFDKLHLAPFSKELDKSLIYLPFYVISYEKETKNRYTIIPPSLMSEMGISAKLKGALGRSKIKSLLTPKFKELAILAENMAELNKTNSIFSSELKRLGTANNILARKWVCEDIETGLLALKKQGWLNDKEYGAIMANVKTTLK